MHQRLAAPDSAADADDFIDTADRAIERDAVEALDDLRTGSSDAEDAATARERIDARCGHRQQRRTARVERQDRGADLYPLGNRSQEAHEAGRVKPVQFGGP